MPIEFLRPNPRNPRQNFDEAELDELAASIRERGIVQPILVRPLPDRRTATRSSPASGAGGRRSWPGLHEVPVVIVEVDDRNSLEFAIIENVQRADLNAIEEAQGYQRLIDEFGYTQDELATVLGKSRRISPTCCGC